MARISIKSVIEPIPAGAQVTQGETVEMVGDENGISNSYLFPVQFTTVSSIVVQDINGVGIDVDSAVNSLTVTGFSITAYGSGPLSYIATGTI